MERITNRFAHEPRDVVSPAHPSFSRLDDNVFFDRFECFIRIEFLLEVVAVVRAQHLHKKVDLDHARLWVHRLKRGLDVEHPIGGDELRAVKRYIAMRTEALPWLFISECGQSLTRQS